jgi:hypothetical protein
MILIENKWDWKYGLLKCVTLKMKRMPEILWPYEKPSVPIDCFRNNIQYFETQIHGFESQVDPLGMFNKLSNILTSWPMKNQSI